MTSDADLAIIRRAYARQIAFSAGTEDPNLIEGLAALPRENFVASGPWSIWSYGAPRMTPDADPLYLYSDIAVPILDDKGLNNGQPSFVVKLIGLCAVHPGDSVTHIGTGTGYFTTLLARLVGPKGRVLGIEIEPELARRAAENLAGWSNVRIVEGNGWTMPLEPSDAILVNAGSPRFAATWLDALKPDGRLVVPLTTTQREEAKGTQGVIFRIVRDADGFAASAELKVAIYACSGAADAAADATLQAALTAGGAGNVKRLVRGETDAPCWLRGDGWALTSS